MNPIVIIGSGLAGYGVARELRKLDKDVQLLMITSDDGVSYSKPMLSNALAKEKTAEALVMASAGQMAEQLNMQIITHSFVSNIDTDKKVVSVGTDSYPYHKLVLAMGAKPIHPSVEGDAANDILSVNSLHDYATFRRKLEGKKKIAILGGGLIGCEFANDLVNAGVKPLVVDRGPEPLGRLLPEQLGRRLKTEFVKLGVEWFSNNTLKSIHHEEHGYRLVLEDDQIVSADLVLSAIGLQANTKLAKESGIAVNRAVVVDEYLQTSDKDVYALGDMVEVNGVFLPFIMPLMRCTKALACTLAGQKTAVEYPAMSVVVKTPVMPLSILPPAAGRAGAWLIEEDEEGIQALCSDAAGNLIGFALSHTKVRLANQLALKV